VRLEPQNARVLFGMVKQEGMANVRIVLVGSVPSSSAPTMVRRAPPQQLQNVNADDDDTTGTLPPPRRIAPDPFYRPNPWQAPDQYDRGYRPPPPPFFGPGRPFGGY
jgi:hypothetical protein